MKVSVIISNYNYARYLPAAISSVLDQTYQDLEIVVIDDGSTDNSREVISQLQQQAPDKIIPIFQPNQGQGAAFNAGFAASSGEVMAFLDADDTWKPDKLQRVVDEFHQHPTAIGVMHSLEKISADGTLLQTRPMTCPTLNHDLASLIIKTGNVYWFPPTSALTYRRCALEKVLPMDTQQWRICADGCLVFCTAFLGPVITIPDLLGSYRLHGENHFSKKQQPSQKHIAESLAGIERTNQYINGFLAQHEIPGQVDLSRNLPYRRAYYYWKQEWNWQEMLSISHLILTWPFYRPLERIFFLMRFWAKNGLFYFSLLSENRVVA
jgi:glycosyltransferase involved in cell wall biosynthesis